MTVYGLWIDYEYCTGCKACEIACQQEHGFDTEELGIQVLEQLMNGGQTYNFMPIPTDLCDLCTERVQREGRPSCVHHCMAKVMEFGPVEDLARRISQKPRSVIWAPKPRPRDQRPFDGADTGGSAQ